MVTVKIYAHALMHIGRNKKKLYAEGIVIRTIRRYRELGMAMIYYEEDAFGSTIMKFIHKDESCQT